MLNASQLDALFRDLRAVTDRWYVMTVQTGGPAAIPPEALQRLIDRGLLTPDILAQIQAGDAPALLDDAMLTGLFLSRLGEVGEDAATWNDDQWEAEIKRRPLPLTSEDTDAVAIARRGVGIYGQGLANRVEDGVGKIIIEHLDADRTRAIVGDDARRERILAGVSDAVAEGAEMGLGARTIASRILDVTEEGARDLLRFATTEATNVHEQAKARDLSRRRGDPLVYKRPRRGCCKDCERLYLRDDGHPRVFRLSEITDNGNNFGRKRDEWLATIDATHPWCSCSLHYMPEGHDFDDEGRIARVDAAPMPDPDDPDG